MEKKPSISQQFYAVPVENGNPPFGSIAVPGLQQEFHLFYLGGSKKSTRCGKVWSEPDFNLANLGGSKNPHGGKEVWSEPDFHSAYFGGSKNPHGGKKVWAEPDFHSAYFGGSKNPHGGKKKHGPNQTSTQPILVDRKKKNTLQSKWEYYRM